MTISKQVELTFSPEEVRTIIAEHIYNTIALKDSPFNISFNINGGCDYCNGEHSNFSSVTCKYTEK